MSLLFLIKKVLRQVDSIGDTIQYVKVQRKRWYDDVLFKDDSIPSDDALTWTVSSTYISDGGNKEIERGVGNIQEEGGDQELGEGSRKESGDRFKLVLEGSGLTDDQVQMGQTGQTGQTEGDRFHLVLEGSGLTDDQEQTGQTRQTGQT